MKNEFSNFFNLKQLSVFWERKLQKIELKNEINKTGESLDVIDDEILFIKKLEI